MFSISKTIVILVEGSANLSIVHHAVDLPIEGLVVDTVLQETVQVLFVHELLSFGHLLHDLEDGLAKTEHVLIGATWCSLVGARVYLHAASTMVVLVAGVLVAPIA